MAKNNEVQENSITAKLLDVQGFTSKKSGAPFVKILVRAGDVVLSFFAPDTMSVESLKALRDKDVILKTSISGGRDNTPQVRLVAIESVK